MQQTRWGIIGPGTIAHNFADGLLEAPSGKLVAIASRSEQRRKDFGDHYGIDDSQRYSQYTDLMQASDVDALYIATPHPWHAELSIAALRAGKSVLCEKPAGMTASQVVAVTEVATQEQRFFMEAFMYRCHPQIMRVLEILRSDEIGTLLHLKTALGFTAPPDPESRAFNPALGGGGILDVGCYPISFARLLAGVAIEKPFDNPSELAAVANLNKTGVDEVAHALLKFKSGFTAECSCAVARDLDNTALITGTRGTLLMKNPWTPGRNAGPSNAKLLVSVNGKSREESIRQPEHLFTFEAEYASQAIAAGTIEPLLPALNFADSIGNAETLDRWRHAVGYRVAEEKTRSNRPLPGVLPTVSPLANPRMPQLTINGLDQPVSQLILGCDNKNSIADGAIVWDAWLEAGGNAFDTAFVYGEGEHESVLGQWIRNRGVANDIVVVGKGAHTPYCTPRAIETQLDISLRRLGLDHVPIYIMHRDNPTVPVGEFVDALNQLKNAGKLKVFGGSNWSTERIDQANEYAAQNGLSGFSVLNNNLSLAVMEKPVWPGCISSSDEQTLTWLEKKQLAHFSWSSQARGYFLPADLRNRLPKSTAPETCFGSEANAERRHRAETLANQRGVSAHNVATAWVLAQRFPSFALTGPRSAGEIVSTLPALKVELTPDEVNWLNLGHTLPSSVVERPV